MPKRIRRQPGQPRGFTLLELLLVLALLVLIGALVMPTTRGTIEKYRLRKSADMIRAEFAKAKAKAMETGRTYVFRYQPSSDGYLVEPWYSDEDYLESDQLGLGTTGFAQAPPTLVLDDAQRSANMRQLPEDVVFVASETEQESRELAAAEDPMAIQANDSTLSAPIFFYPDGTSSTARLLVMNQRPRYIMLTLRGLTGVVYVSDPLTAEQIQ
jgi:prepilin-type N-terminal cleavage/methylation domain-containing protein